MFIFTATSALAALTCAPGDDVCDDVNAMQTIVNAQFTGSPASDAVAQNYYNRLSQAADALESAGCTLDGYLAGRWQGRAGTLTGEAESGGAVTGSLTDGSFTGGFDTTIFGDTFDSIDFKSKRIVANIDTDGIAVGSFTRVSGRVGTFMGLTATCDGGTPPGDAIAPWFPGDLSGFGGAGPTFTFRTDAPSAYTRVDRMGMPAVNTALISSKDAYNAADPTDDVAGTFAGEIVGTISFLHGALDDDLTGLGLTPCTAPGDGSGSCVAQGAPLVLPDTLKIDPASAAGFPNGRTLPDPVIDVTLAVLLLDLGVHDPGLFASLPLNPPANDVSFEGDFPYVAAPQ